MPSTTALPKIRAPLVAAAAAAVLMGGAASATVLPPGGTLDPIPGSFSPPSGTTLLSNSYPFVITHDIEPFNQCPGTLTESVVRLADTTLRFEYRVTLNSTCISVDQFTIRSFSGFDTDVFRRLLITASPVPSSATRTAPTGSSITVNFDDPIQPGETSVTLYVTTNATDFDLNGTATVRSASGGFFSDLITGLAQPVADQTPPIVEITSPGPFGCSCNPITITGTAADPGGFGSYALEYSADPGGPWTLIAGGATPVTNGTLAAWDTSAVAQGDYFVRLTAENAQGQTSVFTTVLFVDKQFDSLDLRLPVAGGIYAGHVCFDGTAWDRCFSRYFVEYAPLPAATPFGAVDAANPFYTTAVINDPLASWDTRTGSTAVPDGAYRVRVRAFDSCNPGVSAQRDIIVDNTPPVAEISSPRACTSVDGAVVVTGTASDANLNRWVLQYAGAGDHQWVTIASGQSNVVGGTLATWDTSRLRPCPYALRLVVTDLASIDCSPLRHQSEYVTVVDVGCESDVDGDGDADVFDLLAYLSGWFDGCP